MSPHGNAPKTAAELTTLMLWSPFVIASRMTQFWMSAASPTAKDHAEASRMVTEKMQAMGESVLAANLAMTEIAIAGATAAVTGIARSSHRDADTVMSAALKPYTSRVRANHKRLSR